MKNHPNCPPIKRRNVQQDSGDPILGKQTMKPYLKLFRKELKSIFLLAIIIIIGVIGYSWGIGSLIVYKYPQLRDHIYYMQAPFIFRFFLRTGTYFRYGYPFMLPVILTYMLNIERETKTHYQMLALPVAPSAYIICKFCAVVSIGVVVSAIFGLVRIIEMKPLLLIKQWLDGTVIAYAPYGSLEVNCTYIAWQILSLFYPSLWYGITGIILFCGLVCLSQSVMTAVKQNKFITWILTFMGGVALFFFPFNMFIVMFYKPLSLNIPYYTMYLLSPLIAGLVFLIIGSYIYNKYAEV